MSLTLAEPSLTDDPGPDENSSDISLQGVGVLLVEDDLALQEAIADTLELAGASVTAVASAEQALQTLQTVAVDMVVTDVNMKGMDGHQLLVEINRSKPCLPVLLITAYASVERSVDAIKNGAVDYLVKPFEPSRLIALVARYASRYNAGSFTPVIEDATSKSLYQVAERVAATDSTVMISGESGTGKEVLARFIHDFSPRSEQPFVAINCAAIPETMLEATLFGHEKGAFTGATTAMPGKFEQSNGGTLLLDEVSEMDLGLQAKLLRVLQEKEVERLGSRKTIDLDVRIIATSNRDLKDYVAQGKFREDLYYRLSVFPLHLQPLRNRADDILPLAERILANHAGKMNRTSVRLSPDARQALLEYSWPGNVRELDNLLQRGLILQAGNTLHVSDLMFNPETHPLAASSKGDDVIPLAGTSMNEPDTGSLQRNVRQAEYQVILDALKENNGSRKDAAARLGVSPRTLRYKMAQMRELGLLDN